jgi:hypothetical protein
MRSLAEFWQRQEANADEQLAIMRRERGARHRAEELEQRQAEKPSWFARQMFFYRVESRPKRWPSLIGRKKAI